MFSKIEKIVKKHPRNPYKSQKAQEILGSSACSLSPLQINTKICKIIMEKNPEKTAIKIHPLLKFDLENHLKKNVFQEKKISKKNSTKIFDLPTSGALRIIHLHLHLHRHLTRLQSSPGGAKNLQKSHKYIQKFLWKSWKSRSQKSDK